MNLPAPAPTSEPLRTVEFAPTDTLLREDVNMLGALVGGLFIGLVEALAGSYLGGEYKLLATFIVLVLVLMIVASAMRFAARGLAAGLAAGAAWSALSSCRTCGGVRYALSESSPSARPRIAPRMTLSMFGCST